MKSIPFVSCWGVLLALIAGTATGQTRPDYPTRPIRIIVAQAPGSGPDIMARVIGQKFTEAWGQQVIVDNRPGANGIIGMEAAAKSKPDGYNLVLGVPSALTMNPYVFKKLPYDTFRDFVPISQLVTNHFGLVVNPSLPVKSVKELVALGKARPGELNYGSFGVGNQTHLAAELFAAETKIKMVHVPYKGQTPAVAELVGGQVALMFTPMLGSAQHVATGKLRLIATAGEKRAAPFPNVPTMVEAGYPSVVITGWTGLLAPTGTSPEVVARLQREVAKHLLASEMRETLSSQGAEAVASTPEQFAAFIKSEAQKWSRVVKQAGLDSSQ
ncbi:MAG: tripartite tricarboxylate transporter substrate binding protein [Betaproteobacteria bacterium]|nr:tripartite tricarboxylate transporter substrate binding protein [Betaproteobacteria bacterium]